MNHLNALNSYNHKETTMKNLNSMFSALHIRMCIQGVYRLCSITTFVIISMNPVHAEEWFMEVGPMLRGDMKISADGGSSAANHGGIATGNRSGRGTSSIAGSRLNDDGTSPIFRSFDDGYVGPSGWEWARKDGVTQFFGYDRPGQYDAAANTLTFQQSVGSAAAGRSRTTTQALRASEPSGWKDSKDTDGAGLMATLGYRFRDVEAEENQENPRSSNEWSALLRFGWLDGMGANFLNRPAYSQEVESRTYASSITREEKYVYTYDTLGNPVFPGAPYAMQNEGAVGPLIADTPDSIKRTSQNVTETERLVRRFIERARSVVDLDVDAEAFTFQAGPRLHWHPAEALSLYLQSALTMNMLDVSARRNERFLQSDGSTMATWREQEDDRSWKWGANVYVGAHVPVSASWYVSVAGGYEWVESSHLRIGPDRVTIDLSGYQVEIAIGWTF